MDVVSGCFEGFVYFIRGKGRLQFEPPRRLLDENKKPIQLGEFWDYDANKWGESKEKEPTQDLCVYPIATDWDGDGDLDLLLGGYRGNLALRINKGGSKEPVFAANNTPVKAGGKLIEAKGGGVSPVIADWDGDGTWDLVCGNSAGAIVWYRNVGSRTAPKLESAREILPAAKESDGDRPCSYLKIAVADMNGDKLLDLVVGAKDGNYKGAIWLYPRK